MKKGDIVRIKAYVETSYNKNNVKKLDRFQLAPSSCDQIILPTGLLLGKSYLATGIGKGCSGFQRTLDDDPSYLDEDKRHPVWVVEPHADEDRYYLTIRCLEKDLELV